MKDYEFQLHPPHDLLPDAKSIDWKELVWNLEKTVEQNPEKWGWTDKKCYCGEPADSWTQETGYRCRRHDRVRLDVQPDGGGVHD